MGYRTVAYFNNDFMHDMKNDPRLGERISNAAGTLNYPVSHQKLHFNYGCVVSHAHMDTTQVIIFNRNKEGFDLCYDRSNDQYLDVSAISQMKDCLERNGYKVIKRRKPKE